MDKGRRDEKREGDGFQLDSLSLEDGYTWVFYFCDQPPSPKYTDVELCPLYARTLSLIDQFGHDNHCVYMDNLYLSAKLCLKSWYSGKVKAHEVCRQDGRDIPDDQAGS